MSKLYKVVKTGNYIKGITNATPVIGKELESKLSAGEVIEINEEQINILKKREWVTLEKIQQGIDKMNELREGEE
jgi:hypothetical protein